jgi:hypothetical protein
MPWTRRLWWGVCVASYAAGLAFILLTPGENSGRNEQAGRPKGTRHTGTSSEEAKPRLAARGPASVSPEPRKPAREAPDCPIVLAKDPLRWLYLTREALASIQSLEDLQDSPVMIALQYYATENGVDEAYALLEEIARTGAPWAFEYLAELAERPEECLKANADMNKHKLSLLALRALFSVDSLVAAGCLESLYERALGREYAALTKETADGQAADGDFEAALHRREAALAARRDQGYLRWNLLTAAAESGSDYGAEMYWQAFASAGLDEKISWLSERIPVQEILAEGDVRTELLRSGLADSSEDVRRATADMLLEERHLQYPLGAERSTALLVEAFEAGESAVQCALLQDVGVVLHAYSSEPAWIGNVTAMDAVLSLGLQSEDESVRSMAQQLEQEVMASAEVERILARAAEDAVWIQELVAALGGDK